MKDKHLDNLYRLKIDSENSIKDLKEIPELGEEESRIKETNLAVAQGQLDQVSEIISDYLTMITKG